MVVGGEGSCRAGAVGVRLELQVRGNPEACKLSAVTCAASWLGLCSSRGKAALGAASTGSKRAQH